MSLSNFEKKQVTKQSFKQYSARMMRCLKQKYREALLQYGDGNIGLFPKKRPGNVLQRFSEATLELAKYVIETVWMTKKLKSKKAAWGEFVLRAKEKGVGKVSYKKFLELIKKYPEHVRTLNREGRRAAYKLEKKIADWLTRTKSRHGDRPWEICHIDHTLVDIQLITKRGGVLLGKPWVTFLVDAYSRRLLAIYLTFDEPSYRSCMMVMRECVRRHGRLPQTIVVDGGNEFGSTYFEMLLARYTIIKKVRPKAKARFGSVIERLFGIMNTQFVHTLLGSTKIMKNVRQVTKANNPKKFAIWNLEDFYIALCEWAYEKYDMRVHPAHGKSPRKAYEQGMAKFGMRPHRLIPYDENFILMTLPSPRKGVVKIHETRGVKINGMYYWNDAFENPTLANQQVDARYDPFDRSIAYVHANGEWLKCHSEHFQDFEGRSEKEIHLRSEELRRSQQLINQGLEYSATALAADIRASEYREKTLQERRDEEAKAVRKRNPLKNHERTKVREHRRSKGSSNNTRPECKIRYGRF